MSATDALLLLTWVAIALLALAMSTLLRRLTLLESGVRPAAALELGPPVGSTVSKDVLRAINCDDRTTTTSLLFVSPSCATCDDILAALRQGSRLADGLVVLSSAPPIPLADGVAVRDGSRLFAELARRGYTQAELEKISSGNMLRVLKAVEAYAASQKGQPPIETPVAK